MTTANKLLAILWVVGITCYVLAWLYMFYPRQSTATVRDYNLGNCSFIKNPDKIMVCFDFNQDGQSVGAYAGSTVPTIFLRTIESDTVSHETIHHLLTRDTDLTEEQQHKFIEDFETIQKEIFKIYWK